MRKLTLLIGFSLLLGIVPLGLAEESQEAQSVPAIENLLKAAELKYLQVPNKEIFVVLMEAEQALGLPPWRVFINYADDDKTYLNVWATMLDNADGYAYATAVCEKAMEYNSSSPGAKLCLDALKGDLDARWDMVAKFSTPELLKFTILDVALTCNNLYKEFSDLVKPSQPAAETKPAESATDAKAAPETK